MNNWAKSVKAEIANTEVRQSVKTIVHRNAYKMNPALPEYNSCKSARDPLKGSKCTLNLNENNAGFVKSINQNQNFPISRKKRNCIQDHFAKNAKLKGTLNGICGNSTKSGIRTTKNSIRPKMVIVPAVGNMNPNLKDGFISTMIMKRAKYVVFCVLSVILGLAISSTQSKDLSKPSNTYKSSRSKDKKPYDNKLKYIPVPLVFGTPQGRSANFTNAQGNQTAPQLSSFFVYRVSNYQLVTITNELLEATKDNAGAFVDEAKLNMDTGFRNISNDLAHDLFGLGDGTRGQYSSITTGVIQLNDTTSIVNFEVGMSLVSYSISSGTYTQSTGAAIGYVIAVDRGLNTVTVSTTPGGSAGTPTNWSTSFPFLGVQGDVQFGTPTTAFGGFQKVTGLSGWVPSVSPGSSDSFWGVNRSADVTRLAGVRYNGSGESIEEALIDGSSLVAREGGQPDMCFINFQSYAALEKSLGAKVQYVDVKHDEADIAFAGIRIHAPYGPITVIPDRSCPVQTAYLLQMDTWKLRSLGRAPHILTYGLEGLEGIRVGNADALEIRIGYYANLICNAPGWNAVVSLSS